MRFLLKLGFWLALIAFFLPTGGGEDGDRGSVNYFGAFLGAQQALSDLGGFCDRSPAACDAGRDVGAFVAARVGDGIAYGVATIRGSGAVEDTAITAPVAALPARTPSSPPPASEPAAHVRTTSAPIAAPAAPKTTTDPMQTAAVAAEHVRRTAGLPPFAMPVRARGTDRADKPEPSAFVHAGNSRSIPLPTPRP